MKQLFLSILIFYSIITINAKQVPVVNFKQVENVLNQKNDTTYLVNFWATWCIPCRVELPYIEQINIKYSNNKFKSLLISLDFPSKVESSLIPYINNNEIDSEVWLLDEKDPNLWIDKVDKGWSGAIPASVIFNKHTKLFYEKSFEFEELDSIIKQLIIK